jgi:hypothetical protein
VAYELLVGPVPADRALDHLCRRRNCCRPEHLEPVTHSENEKRKAWRYRRRLKLCSKAHDPRRHGRLTPEGGRICRLCSGV